MIYEKKSCFLILVFILLFSKVHAQLNHSLKAEAGFSKYMFRTIQVDPGPNWKGYNLSNENGVELNIINSFAYKNKLFAGLGVGYLNFEGINGISLYYDFEYLPFQTRLTPLLNMKIGYSHIWNQYENGTRTGLTEFGLGLNFRMTEKLDGYTKSGVLLTQQSFLIPFKIGVRFQKR
jgi:hypothetical protein